MAEKIEDGFTKGHSLILKGFMIGMLLFHHVFYGDTIIEKGISISFGRIETFANWVSYGRLCLSGFVFISAYGITQQLKAVKTTGEYIKVCRNRIIKISKACLFVYFCAAFYRQFIIRLPIKEAYKGTDDIFRPIYMLFDALGYADLFQTPLFNVTWWYFSYAILLICSVPAIYLLCQKISFLAFPLALYLAPGKMIGIAVLGVAFACDNTFFKIEDYIKKDKKNKWLMGIGCYALLYISYAIIAYKRDVSFVMDWIGAIYAIIVMLFISKIPIIAPVLKIIGKHSSTMFMIHTFIYLYYHGEFIYSFHKDYLIYIVLFVCSFTVAFLIDSFRRVWNYFFLKLRARFKEVRK